MRAAMGAASEEGLMCPGSGFGFGFGFGLDLDLGV